MSWEIFRKNILQISLRPENIGNTDIIAKTYAREYDLAVKRGGDIANKVPLQKGNVKISAASFNIDKNNEAKFTKVNEQTYWLAIQSGTIEMNNNKVIVLAD